MMNLARKSEKNRSKDGDFNKLYVPELKAKLSGSSIWSSPVEIQPL